MSAVELDQGDSVSTAAAAQLVPPPLSSPSYSVRDQCFLFSSGGFLGQMTPHDLESQMYYLSLGCKTAQFSLHWSTSWLL